MAGTLQYVYCSQDIGAHIVRWLVNRRNDVPNASQVKDVSCFMEDGVIRVQRADIFLLKDNVGAVGVMLQVLQTSPNQIVNHVDTETVTNQEVYHVAADKPGTSGYNCDRFGSGHINSSSLSVRT